MSMWDVNFQKLAYNLTPHFLRSTRLLEWLYSLMRPVRDVNISFQSFRDGIIYKLQFTGQVIYLEHTLNDRFDPSGRGIYIEDTSNIDFDYLFQKVEQNTEIYLYQDSEASPHYIQNQIEYDVFIHFIVRIPAAVTYDLNAVRALVDCYKQAGRNYLVLPY